MRGLALALLLAACGPSGVKIEVHAPMPLDTLTLWAAVDDGKGGYVIDSRLDGSQIDVSGRDLSKSPYQVLVQEDDGARAAKVVLTAIGQRGGNDVAFGQLMPPQDFRSGDLVLRRVDLVEFTTPPYDEGDGCMRVPGGITLGSSDDHDCDGYKNAAAGGDDCNDDDPTIHPGAPEICGNGKDDNCNGMIDEDVDEDHDGFTTCTGHDCNDMDPAIHPGAAEICDGKDNDCNGQCDETFDMDGDRFTTCGTRRFMDGTCSMPSQNRVDCNDNDAAVHPGAPEVCNGKDDNCNGQCDEGFDMDGDTYTTCGTRTDMCPIAPASAEVDCNDMDAFVHPGQREVCDGLDDDCNPATHAGDAEFCFTNMNGCLVGTRPCNDATPPGFTGDCVAIQSGMDPAPAGYCSAYAACAASSEEDKLGCTATMAMATILVCDVAFDANGLCANAQVMLPGPTAGTCMWTMDGTTTRDGYTLGLLDNTATPQTTSALCMPTFAVTMAPATTPGPTSAFLSDSTMGMTVNVALLLAPQTVAQCPANALHCR